MKNLFVRLFALGAVVAVAALLAWATIPPGDFITGGGWVLSDHPSPPAPAMANFGAAGGCKNGEFWGHLTHVDHGFPSNLKIKGLDVRSYTVIFDGPDEANGQRTGGRRIRGRAEVSQTVSHLTTCNPGEPATYRLEMIDNGEPGHGDIYRLAVCAGTQGCRDENICYEAKGNLGEGQSSGGGNIQLHKGNPSNTRVDCPEL